MDEQINTRASHLSKRSDATLLAVLIAAAALPYLNGLLNGFVYDDQTQILNNPYILNFHHLHQIFTSSAWSYMGQAGITNYYRPLMTAGYLLCYQVFGKVAFGYHLVNLVLHAAVVCALFGLTLALFGRRNVAFLAALIFALHPVHTESVDWIAGVTDLEVTLFCLLAFWFFIKAARPGGKRAPGWILAMAVSFSLALLSKEQALMLPLLATVYEHAYREDKSSTAWKQKAARYGIFWLLSAAYLAARIRALGAFAPVVYKSRVPWAHAFLSAPALAGHYLWKLFWPWYLCAFYIFHPSTRFYDPRVLAGVAALIILGVAFAALWKRHRAASFGIVWFLVMLAPVLNARWLAANVFAERYLYLPSVGFCWVIAFCAVWFWERLSLRRVILRRGLAAGGVLLLLLCAIRIFTRNRDWRNDIRLYTRTLSQQPGAAPILNNLGTVYWARGEADQAAREWQLAYRAQPTLVPVLDNLGLYYSKEGDYPKAVTDFERAIRLNPAYAQAHLHLGLAYEKMGRAESAEPQLRTAVALTPSSAATHAELGKFYLAAGQDAQAEEQFRMSVECAPSVESLDDLGKIYLRHGRPADAQRAFEGALALNHFDSVAHFNLAAIAADTGKDAVAEREYRIGLETDPKNAGALESLRKLQAKNTHEQKPQL
ncbi:MAG TPA: tetratricopeptide repeat protein [Terriglobia bacterium]|nr:tetratricopeptide repeat protein [Terriglobia bacterium]